MFKHSMYNMHFPELIKGYYYNSLSGELIKVNEETSDYISNIESNKQAKEFDFFMPLYEKGFIVNTGLNEYARIRALHKELLYSSQSEQASYVIALTTACNYRCFYCYEKGSNIESMDENTASEIIAFIIKEAERNKILKEIHVTWFGGEPLLQKRLIEYLGNELLKYCKKRSVCLITSIITNGYHLNEDCLDMLNRYNLRYIQITLDGQKDYYDQYKCPIPENAFETVIRNIRYVSKSNKITIRLNCTSKNYESIKSLCNDIIADKQINKDKISFALSKVNMSDKHCLSAEEFTDYKLDFIHYLKEKGLTENIRMYLPEPRLIPCGLLKRTNYVIDSNGYLYKCEHYVGKSQFSVGNVSDGLLYPDFQKNFEEAPFFDNCHNCNIFPLCRGGCSERRFAGLSSVSCEKKKEEIAFILNMIIREKQR